MTYPRGGGDVRASSPQKSNISHNDLPAHGEPLCQNTGTDWLIRLPQRIEDGLSALFCLHKHPSL